MTRNRVIKSTRRSDTTLVRQWCDWQAAAGARPATLELRRSQVCRLARDVGPLLELGTQDLAGWLARPGWSRETLRSHRSAVRMFYRWAWDSALIESDPAARLPRVKPAPVLPRAAAEDVIDKALANAEPRVELMLMLASRCGLRRGEICQVHVKDLVADLVGWSLLVHGKGGRERMVPMTADMAAAVLAWRAGPGGWFFGNGKGSHLTPAHTGKLMRRALASATAHQLRHRFATQVYRKKRDLEGLRLVMGHASVVTTQRYIAIDPAELRDLMGGAA